MPSDNALKTKGFTFGTCSFQRTSPSRKELTAETKVVNIIVSFEDALKLNLAVNECVRKLNTYNRSYRRGKNAALNLTIHLEKSRITVNEGKLSTARRGGLDGGGAKP